MAIQKPPGRRPTLRQRWQRWRAYRRESKLTRRELTGAQLRFSGMVEGGMSPSHERAKEALEEIRASEQQLAEIKKKHYG
jgi:hypothetical protein